MKDVSKQYDMFPLVYREAQIDFYNCHEDITRFFLHTRMQRVAEGAQVLDMGCGYGKDAATLSENGFNVIGIDSSKEMIQIAREMHEALDFRVFPLSDVPFKDESFDAIFSRYAIDYLPNVSDAFVEARRVLKPGGEFNFCVNHPELMRIARDRSSHEVVSQNLVELPVFEYQCILTKPFHKLTDFLDPVHLQFFELNWMEEGKEHSKKFNVPGKSYDTPEFLVVSLRKKE
tara:strand:+ start:3372 stop:4064 length:693 start_codon:yes stop_codon:yes gene_type:complete